MSAQTSPTVPAQGRTEGNRVVWGAVSALGVVAAGLVLLIALSLVSWAVDRPIGAGPLDAARVAVQAWYLAHGVGLPVSWGTLSVPPLLITVLIAVFFYRSGRSAVRACALRAPMQIAECTAAMAITYTTAAILLTELAYPGPELLSITEVAIAAGVISVLAPLAGMLRESGYGARIVSALPGPSYAYCRGALASLWTLAAASALVIACSVVISYSEASAITASLAPTGLGGLTVVGISIAYLPNAMLLTTALGSGAGFGLGAGSVYSLTAVQREPLPAFPLFAALPQSTGLLTWLVALVPLSAAVVGALTMTRNLEREHRTPLNLIGGTAMGSLLTAAAVLGAAVVAAGSLGDGRLAAVGAAPLRTGLWLLGILLVAGGLTAFIATAKALTPAAAARRRRALSVIETTADLTANEGDEVEEIEPAPSRGPVIASKLAMRRLARTGKFAAARKRQQASEKLAGAAVAVSAAEPPPSPSGAKRTPSSSLSVVKRLNEQRAAKAVANDTGRPLTGEREPSGAGATLVRRTG
ncbi:DUF6350 family protein [Blastococcus sp. Marseille-P5729]|uniref:cell division protein PerM n=1 Tax=Blastococcus sp. Marseille-P5729 TaxID=2086582 RepID=UPI00131CA927|nr:DUF6350 family protein [Blastococcus sp. Marseille-P5729]